MEEKKTIVQRLDVFDGLRGLAIVFVFLNHVDSVPFVSAFPTVIRPLIEFWFSSGTIAVSFFFILSGFLMGYLYTNPQPMSFIRKRYARIFPPFLVMVISMSLFRQLPTISLFNRIAFIFFVAYVIRLIWIHAVEKYHLGPTLIKLFLGIQAFIFVWYGLIVMRHPPIWFASLPFWVRESTISLVNITLTLPLGDYIPLLDGVYWSLIGEVLFYLVYPFLFAPTVNGLRLKSNVFSQLFFFLLIPFFFGLHALFANFKGYSMIYIEYFFYFCVGIAVAELVKIRKPIVSRKFLFLVHPICFIALLFTAHEILFATQGWINTLVKLLWAILFGLITYYLIDENTSLHKYLQKKVWVFLGTISYSLYITHTAIVDGIHLLVKPIAPLINVIFIALTIAVAIGVAYVVHQVIEIPYFQFKEPKTDERTIQSKAHRVAIGVFISFLLLTYVTKYMGGFNFFSVSHSYDISAIQTPMNTAHIQLSEVPLSIQFSSPEDNLGIITFHITHESIPNRKSLAFEQKQRVVVRIKERRTTQWLAEQKTSTPEIGQSSSYPFGFPPVTDAKGKKYEVQLSLENVDPTTRVVLHINQGVMKSIHQLNKKTVLTNPILLVRLITIKCISIVQNKEAQLVLITTLPFLLLYTYLAFKR